MQDIDYVLNFVTQLGKEMLLSGANLERVNLTMEIICKAYGLLDINIFSLSTNVSVSAETPDGEEHIHQVAVPPVGIHLEKLRRLNNLSYRVREEKPDPKKPDGYVERNARGG